MSPMPAAFAVSRRCPTDLTLSSLPTYFLVPCNSNSWYLFSTILLVFSAYSQCYILPSSIFNGNSFPCRLQFKLLIFISTNALTQSLTSWIPTIYSLPFAMLLSHLTLHTSIIFIILQSSVHIHWFFTFVSQCLLVVFHECSSAPNARLPPPRPHLFRLLHYTNVFIFYLVSIMYIIPHIYIYPVVDQI